MKINGLSRADKMRRRIGIIQQFPGGIVKYILARRKCAPEANDKTHKKFPKTQKNGLIIENKWPV